MKASKLYMLGLMILGLFGSGAEAGEPRKAHKTSEGDQYETATFAGGCFWCMEPPFDKLEGVVSTTVGYTGGSEKNPTYEQVASGRTGHAEAIQVVYDPARISYQELLDVFWRNIDPTQPNGQFVDMGRQYRTAIFYHDEGQKRLAEASREELARSGPFDAEIVTEIEPAGEFYEAEEYHQDYYQKSPTRYKLYRKGSGRDHYLDEVWGDTDH
jgi:methionine-S-sulfoxide reductase